MSDDPELWWPVRRLPRYWVSTHGRVCRYGRILRPGRAGNGHPTVSLSEDGTCRSFSVAALVAEAFLPPPPSARHILGHRDGDQANCRADNLYWTTFSEVAIARGVSRRLTPEAVAAIRVARGKASARQLAAEHGVTPQTVRDIWRCRTWKGT